MKNTKYMIFVIALIAMLAAASISFVSCSKESADADGEIETEDVAEDDDEDVVDTNESFENGISFEEEEEDADIVAVEAPDADFYGTWTATSDMANYLYGNIDITIKDDGTWTGNITETDFKGSWEKEGNSLHVVSDDGDIDFLFSFTENGTLVMQRDISDEDEDGDAEYVNTVLTKK